jgi:SAM-dependent methyltransferase
MHSSAAFALLVGLSLAASAAGMASSSKIPRSASKLARLAHATTVKEYEPTTEHITAAPLEASGLPPPPYWFDPRIHNLGNAGLMGGFHAAVAPICTHLIDRLAYAGVDARKRIHQTIDDAHSVLDMCCGVAFSAKKGAVGVDTSKQMIGMARLIRPDATFVEGNAETYGEDASFDVVTVMYATHEMPRAARRRVISNALRVARKYVLVVDIAPGFTPSEMMLSGEPYVEDYLANMDDDVAEVASNRAWRKSRISVVKDHVVMWRLDV